MIDLTQKELASLLLRGLLLGAALGVFYDAIRFVKAFFFVNYTKGSPEPCGFKKVVAMAVTFITDVIFCLVIAVTSILLLYSVGGIFRGMIYPAMLAGFLLYYLTVGRLVLKLSVRLAKTIKSLLLWVLKLLWRPFFSLQRGIISLYHLTIGKILGTIKSKKRIAQERRKATECKEAAALPQGKEELVYVNGKTGYKREGRIRLSSNRS
jgi:hypothetical protein